MEEKNERGVAHIVEHLAFNATEARAPQRACRHRQCHGPACASEHLHALWEFLLLLLEIHCALVCT